MRQCFALPLLFLLFGILALSKEGLSYGSSFLDWDDIKGVRIHKGFISVRERGEWHAWGNISVSRVANLYVFLALVNQVVGVDN